MNIFYENIPYGALPCFKAYEDQQYYTIDNDKIISLKTNYFKKDNYVWVNLFPEEISIEYKVTNKLGENYPNDIHEQIRKKKLVSSHIINYFSSINCIELQVISSNECFMTSTYTKDSIMCRWSRKVGYLGINEKLINKL